MPGFNDLSPENRSTLVGRLADAADRFLSQLIATGHKVVPQETPADRAAFLVDLGWTEEELSAFESWDSDPRLSDLRTYALAVGQELRLECRAFDRHKPFHMETAVVRRSSSTRTAVGRSVEPVKWATESRVVLGPRS